MFLRRRLNRQEGFTLAEILVAGVIMAVCLIPMAQMFSTSYRGIRTYEKIQSSMSCAKAITEEIRSMPYYEPYNATIGDADIDDHYWGSREHTYDNPGTSSPDWENIPKVACKGYGEFTGYEDFRADIQLSYLDDDTGVAEMKGANTSDEQDDWGPKRPGYDRPMNSTNATIHLLLVRVTIYWTVETAEFSYTVEEIITDTEAVYNLGVSRITVLGPEEIQDPNKPYAAAHWPNVEVQLEIEGWGFDKSTVTASLVRDMNKDIPITFTQPPTETLLRGTVRLYNTGTDIPGEADWFPRAAIGYWTLRIHQQEIINVYSYEGFVVNYPRPVITNFGNNPDMGKEGLNIWTAASLRIEGGPFVNLVKNPSVRLLRYEDDDPINGEVLDQINGTNVAVTVPAGTNGYAAAGCTITATFDLTSGAPGNYRMVVINTDEPTLIGHVPSDPSSLPYVIKEVPPEVDDVFLFGTIPPVHTCYKNIGDQRLQITGSYFNEIGTPPVEVWICKNVVGGVPDPAACAKGTWVASLGNNAIVADFKGTDLLDLSEGKYMAYVKNLNNGLAGWTKNGDGTPKAPLTLATFSGGITSFAPDAGNGFYENYYDIPSKITGSGLLSATDVRIWDSTASVEYDDIEYSVTNDTTIAVNLNLIDCDHNHAWKARVYLSSTYYLEVNFSVTLGRARINNPANSPNNAIVIDARRRASEVESHAETLTTNAWAWSGRRFGGWWYEGYGTFHVRGKGFPMPANGTTYLKVWITGNAWYQEGNFSCVTDRARKIVIINTPEWLMPRSLTTSCNINIYRTGVPGELIQYLNRWNLVN